MIYLKWVYGSSILDGKDEFKIGEVNTCNKWNKEASSWEERGGFNFSNLENILRWVSRGDTLYDVTIPKDAEVINVQNYKTPNGIFVANKIIIDNPRKVCDELTLELYKKSNMPKDAYYETIGALAISGCYETCLEIIKDKVNMNNISKVFEKYNNFIKPWHKGHINYDCYNKVLEVLEEIKNPLLINIFIDKNPYIKSITRDKVINLTGESGSGKSYYSNKYMNSDKYIVIDTDIVFGSELTTNKESLELRKIFKDKPKDYLINNFDDFYMKVLNYYKASKKTIVIDSAQYRNIKNYNILKGEIIVIRTCINTCYKRVLDRYKKINNNYDNNEYIKYKTRKKGMFSWYKAINKLLKNVDGL